MRVTGYFSGTRGSGVVSGSPGERRTQVAFLIPGQGSQSAGMVRQYLIPADIPRGIDVRRVAAPYRTIAAFGALFPDRYGVAIHGRLTAGFIRALVCAGRAMESWGVTPRRYLPQRGEYVGRRRGRAQAECLSC